MVWHLSYCIFFALRVGVAHGVVVFLSWGTILASWETTLGIRPMALVLHMHWDPVEYLNSLLHSSFICGRNTHNKLVIGCKKSRRKMKYPLCTVVYHKGR